MKRLHTLVCFLCFESFSFHLEISLVGEIVVNYPFGKTLNSIDLVNLMSSVSVRFNSFLFLYSIFNEHKSLAALHSAWNPCYLFHRGLTCDFRRTSPICGSRHCRVVGLDGLEPSTSRLSGVRSNHLSYKPIILLAHLVLVRSIVCCRHCRLVEMMGFEPMTPCLQGRCSPS